MAQKLPFTVSARTARLIGRENVANAEGALIELVKNCYDADSELAIVLFDKEKDCLYILDNGDGMSETVIKDEWMTIGTDEKLLNPITTNKRIKSGAKGIGRFALDRLGKQCTMITFAKLVNTGLRWVVNWEAFEEKKEKKNKKIHEVFATLENIDQSSYKNEILKEIKNKEVVALLNKQKLAKGTLLKITGLRDKWKEDDISDLFKNLELLTPPNGSNPFKIWVLDAEKPTMHGLVKNADFNNYDYRIVAQYEKNKNRIVTLTVYRNELDFSLIDKRLFSLPDMKTFPFNRVTLKKESFQLKKPFSELIRGFDDKGALAETISNFEFSFYFLKNSFSKEDKLKFHYKEIPPHRSEWLKKFGGIKLYRDNFRVRPYGEIGTPSYDWLMLGERQGLSPAGVARKGAWRVRPNQVAGVVKFSRLNNLYFDDKSSREGLQENDTLTLFKNILKGIIRIVEDDRSTIASNLSELQGIINEDTKAIEDSGEIADETEEDDDNASPDQLKAKKRVLQKGIKAQEKLLGQKNEEITISRSMASAGIMIASFSHEFYGFRNSLTSRTGDIKKYFAEIVDQAKASKVPPRKNPFLLLAQLEKEDARIKQWIEFAIGLTQRDRRQITDTNLVDFFATFSSLWNRLFKERHITLKISYVKSEYTNLNIRISELDLHTIFDNLITNSIEAFQKNDFNGKKNIEIDLKLQTKIVSITYKDSGPGIDKSYGNINDIFNPFETSKVDDEGNPIGTGLGMWLLKSSADFNRASVNLKRPPKGFEINFTFKSI